MDKIHNSGDDFKNTRNWDTKSSNYIKGKTSENQADDDSEEEKENDLLSQLEVRLNKKREEIMNIIRNTPPQKN